jgi:hypothetical protein
LDVLQVYVPLGSPLLEPQQLVLWHPDTYTLCEFKRMELIMW